MQTPHPGAKPRPASCSTATPEYVDCIGVSELDVSTINWTFLPLRFRG